MAKILITDDDANISDMVSEALINEGYNVIKAYSGTEALMILSQTKPDLVLLDLMLPGLTGEELLPKIKDIPVIIVSAKADISDKVGLLMGGAADYITKPFNISELLARVAVQLRQKDRGSSDNITCGELALSCERLSVTVNDIEVQLTRTECAILKLLMQNPDRPVGKTTILDKISFDTPDCTERSLKQHISNIRHKISAVNGRDYIEAVYGIGFRFRS
jgi:DNA-binding response OmpR family regulator